MLINNSVDNRLWVSVLYASDKRSSLVLVECGPVAVVAYTVVAHV